MESPRDHESANTLPSNEAAAINSSHTSSSPELSSPPRSLSDPGSPGTNQSSTGGHDTNSVVAGGVPTAPPAKRKYIRKVPYVPRVKSDTTPATNPDGTPKIKKPRKPRDPNAPPTKRKSKKSDVNPVSLSHTGSSIEAVAQLSSSTTQQGNIEGIPRPVSSFFSQPSTSTLLQHHPSQQSIQSQRPYSAAQPHIDSQPGLASSHFNPSRFDPVRDTITQHSTNGSHESESSPSGHSQPVSQVHRVSTPNTIASMLNHVDQNIPFSPPVSFFKNHTAPLSTPVTPTTGKSISSVSQTDTVSHKVERHNPYAKEYITPVVKTNGRNPLPSSRNPLPAAPESGHINKRASATATNQLKDNAPATIQTPIENTIVVSTGNGQAKPIVQPVTVASPKVAQLSAVTPPPLPGSDSGDVRGPTIRIRIEIDQPNQTVNFTQLAEKAYGWDAMHPRLAAQRDRLARAALAGAALEEKARTQKENGEGEGDEMSLDLSEGENSNVEMGGMSDGRTGTDGGKKVTKKRKMKEDDYDKLDGFVDDSDMIWEAHAAATKDGFFVYSGPLVTEEDPSQVARAEPAKRGRAGKGRGGKAGTASTRGGAAATGGATAGGRGTTTVRKPRVTKADRARMEVEKVEREKQGLVATPPGSYNSMLQNNAQAMATTPAVSGG